MAAHDWVFFHGGPSAKTDPPYKKFLTVAAREAHKAIYPAKRIEPFMAAKREKAIYRLTAK